MKIKWLVVSVMATAIYGVGTSPSKALAASPQIAVQVQGGWDQPPAEYRDVQRQGFHDGIEAAHRDFDHHRRADADDHEEYRHPHVDHAVRGDYREGFRHGYEVATHHLMDHDDH